MTPTLNGRLQTRLVLAALVGLPVALLVAAVLGGVTVLGALSALGVMTVLGLGWEAAYHAIQQRRWDRDWPSALALAVGVPEAFVAWPVLRVLGLAPASLTAHLTLFLSIWVVAWLMQQGPLSVLLPQWRHRGGRFLGDSRAGAPHPRAARPAPVVSTTNLPGWATLTRQRVVLVGMFATAVVGALLLQPIVGGKTDQAPAASAPADRRPDAAQTRIVPGVAKATWDTKARVEPTFVEFKGAGVVSLLPRVKLKENGALATPDRKYVAWYAEGAAPGQRGPTVLVGDIATVFRKLDQAEAGQRLRVVRVDGSQINYRVDRVTSVDASSFPSEKVYGRTLKPVLRLIGYDTSTGRNIIVFAHAVSMTTPPARG